jgi:hypothetical protein
MEYVSVPMVVVFIGAFISALGALWVNQRQNAEAKRTSDLRLAFEKELREKSDEIAKLNREIAESVTGGNSYCLIRLNPVSDTKAQLLIRHHGEAPLYDLAIRIHDSETAKNEKQVNTLQDIEKLSTLVKVGTLFPKLVTVHDIIAVPAVERVKFNIHSYARNGTTSQELILLKSNGRWIQAARVFRTESAFNVNERPEPMLLEEDIDPDFPRNHAGEIDWD